MTLRRNKELSLILDKKSGKLKKEYSRYRKCEICNSDNFKILFFKNGFRFVKCIKCGFVYVSPVLKEEKLVELYSKGKDYTYNWFYKSQNKEEIKLKRKYFEKKAKIIEKTLNKDKGSFHKKRSKERI